MLFLWIVFWNILSFERYLSYYKKHILSNLGICCLLSLWSFRSERKVWKHRMVEPGFKWLLMLLMLWIPAHTCIPSSLSNSLSYTHTHSYVGFKCEEMHMTFSRGTLLCTEYHRNKMCQFWWNTTLKRQLHKSWCMNWLCQSWLRCDGVGLPCGVQIYTLYFFCWGWEGWYSVSFFRLLLLPEDSLCSHSLEYAELEILLIFSSLTSSCLSLPLFLAPSCFFFFVTLHISISVHSFPSYLLFFWSFLLKIGKPLFLDNRR